MKQSLVLVALASCVTAAADAVSPPVPDNLQACSKVPDAGERVRCYDAEIAKMNAAAASTAAGVSRAPATSTAAGAAPPPVAAAAPRAASPSTTAKFGEETLPATARPQARPEEEAALLSSITALRKVGQQKYAISLANGQVWSQEEPSQLSLFFRVGDSVRIEKAALGSYHMSTDRTGAKNWVRVTRVQ